MINSILYQSDLFSIKWYGALLAFGLIGSFILFRKEGIENHIPKETILELYLYTSISFLIGCRIFYVLFYKPQFYLQNPLKT